MLRKPRALWQPRFERAPWLLAMFLDSHRSLAPQPSTSLRLVCSLAPLTGSLTSLTSLTALWDSWNSYVFPLRTHSQRGLTRLLLSFTRLLLSYTRPKCYERTDGWTNRLIDIAGYKVAQETKNTQCVKAPYFNAECFNSFVTLCDGIIQVSYGDDSILKKISENLLFGISY